MVSLKDYMFDSLEEVGCNFTEQRKAFLEKKKTVLDKLSKEELETKINELKFVKKSNQFQHYMLEDVPSEAVIMYDALVEYRDSKFGR